MDSDDWSGGPCNILPDIVRHFETNFDQNDLTFELPRQLREMELQSRSIELIYNPTIQPLKLIYSHHKVSKSVAMIFVNT